MSDSLPPYFQESHPSYYPAPQGLSMSDDSHPTHERAADLAGDAETASATTGTLRASYHSSSPTVIDTSSAGNVSSHARSAMDMDSLGLQNLGNAHKNAMPTHSAYRSDIKPSNSSPAMGSQGTKLRSSMPAQGSRPLSRNPQRRRHLTAEPWVPSTIPASSYFDQKTSDHDNMLPTNPQHGFQSAMPHTQSVSHHSAEFDNSSFSNTIFTEPSVAPKALSQGKISSVANPFYCPTCDKSFTRKGGLQRHERIHDGSVKFTCLLHICNVNCAFPCNDSDHFSPHQTTRADKMTDHLLAKHGQEFTQKEIQSWNKSYDKYNEWNMAWVCGDCRIFLGTWELNKDFIISHSIHCTKWLLDEPSSENHLIANDISCMETQFKRASLEQAVTLPIEDDEATELSMAPIDGKKAHGKGKEAEKHWG